MYVDVPDMPATGRSDAPPARTQRERTDAMKSRLVDAAIESLVEQGYAQTTAVEICRRAGVTRGAFHHHFPSLAALLTDVLERLYGETIGNHAQPTRSLAALIRRGFERTRRPAFKAVIEIWLAARNDAELRRDLAPAIARMSRLFEPDDNAALGRLVSREDKALYRLAVEAMIGLALGRAVSPDGRPVAHEGEVIELLASLAGEHGPTARTRKRS
jgi:AcrR family transcriptional regulator